MQAYPVSACIGIATNPATLVEGAYLREDN